MPDFGLRDASCELRVPRPCRVCCGALSKYLSLSGGRCLCTVCACGPCAVRDQTRAAATRVSRDVTRAREAADRARDGGPHLGSYGSYAYGLAGRSAASTATRPHALPRPPPRAAPGSGAKIRRES